MIGVRRSSSIRPKLGFSTTKKVQDSQNITALVNKVQKRFPNNILPKTKTIVHLVKGLLSRIRQSQGGSHGGGKHYMVFAVVLFICSFFLFLRGCLEFQKAIDKIKGEKEKRAFTNVFLGDEEEDVEISNKVSFLKTVLKLILIKDESIDDYLNSLEEPEPLPLTIHTNACQITSQLFASTQLFPVDSQIPCFDHVVETTMAANTNAMESYYTFLEDMEKSKKDYKSLINHGFFFLSLSIGFILSSILPQRSLSDSKKSVSIHMGDIYPSDKSFEFSRPKPVRKGKPNPLIRKTKKIKNIDFEYDDIYPNSEPKMAQRDTPSKPIEKDLKGNVFYTYGKKTGNRDMKKVYTKKVARKLEAFIRENESKR